MTSEPAGAMPADEKRPNWQWLQSRINEKDERSKFNQWLDSELSLLEKELADWVTPRSNLRDQRRTNTEQDD